MAIVGTQYSSLLWFGTIFLILLVTSCPLAISTLHNSSEIDRQALLCLKSHLSDPSGSLDLWRNESDTFCNWPGVLCNARHTTRVVALNLASLNISGILSPCVGDLHYLHRIDMSHNRISGRIPPGIGHLTRLRYLNLSMNSITGVIPDAISSCSSLKVIRLVSNFIEGEIPPSLAQLRFLQEITLSYNKLNGTIPPSIGLLPDLKFLFLSGNNLEGSIPESLGGGSSLSIVGLEINSLTGGIPSLLVNSLSLRKLGLLKNNLSGNLPSAIFNSSSLVSLDLAYNNFSGSIPSSYSMSSRLQEISLTGNSLSGNIPPTMGNFSSLSIVLLAQNNLQGSIPESLAAIPGLKALDLAYNYLSGIVPPQVYRITSLTYLGLGNNQLVGRIPSDIGYTLPKIEILVMEGNGFEGPLPMSLVNASSIRSLELRGNMFTGFVSSAYWSLPNLIQLDLGANQLDAIDWSSLSSSSSTHLRKIYLDNNKLRGILPNSIGNLSRNLELLFLTENFFSGSIPSEIGNLTNLTIVQLEGNLFSGGIPETVGNLGKLFALNLARNRLSGEIPWSIGNMERLNELNLQENNLSGSIPPSLEGCTSMGMLNLSYNAIEGSIPPELLSISSLSEGLDLSHNKLTGSISSNVGHLINLGSFHISNNNSSGEIPRTLGACLHLESLRLEDNFLHGSIPSSFISLRGLIEMDLSQNNLSGEIPNFIETFSSLHYLNLSFNNLDGAIPTGGVFSNSSMVFVQGNKNLCANHMMPQLPLCISRSSKRLTNSYIILILVPLSSVIIVLMACVAIIFFKKRSRTKKYYGQSCKELKRFSYSDLAKATNGLSSANLIGSGRFGIVYKGTFQFEARPVAVKVFNLGVIGAPRNFFSECEVLRNTRHRNVIRVISLCSSLDRKGNDFKALVLDYMENGNLENWLHPNVHKHIQTRTLNLGSKIMIAMDIAAALDYLHNCCTPPLVHCDLKPSNVLLDDHMVAHICDFGLAKFLCNHSSVRLDSSTNILGPRGSIGYIAPEYGMGCEISSGGDVYSYGVILLEMLTGKHPTDGMFKDGLNLHRLVDSVFPHNIGDILESNLTACYIDEANHDLDNENQIMVGMQSCIKQLAKIGLNCSSESPKDRPTIRDVYYAIITIKETFSALHS
ncbi:hypothetical protein ACP4OV_009032 [Aristida adscensionis]